MSASSASSEASSITPADLSFLTIYNPSLADKDDNLQDQIVFYASRDSLARRRRRDHGDADDPTSHEDENEKLRQVGLAQGMVSFARYVPLDKNVDLLTQAGISRKESPSIR